MSLRGLSIMHRVCPMGDVTVGWASVPECRPEGLGQLGYLARDELARGLHERPIVLT